MVTPEIIHCTLSILNNFFCLILFFSYFGCKVSLNPCWAQLLSENQAGSEEIDAGLYPECSEFRQNIWKRSAHTADSEEPTDAESGWENPRKSLPEGWNIAQWPWNSRHKKQWNGGKYHQKHHIFTISYQTVSYTLWRCRRIERCRSRWSPYH